MKIASISLALSISYSPIICAGVFGPDNLEDCILEKMKGQDRALYPTARAACLKAFPPEVEIDRARLKFTWCESQSESEAVCLDQKPPNVTITKVVGLFYEEKCDATQYDKPGTTATATKPWYGTTYKFTLPQGNRKCANFSFYGIEK